MNYAERYFPKAAHSYEQLLKRVKTARWPYEKGKALNSAMRGMLRDDPDYVAPVIDLYSRKYRIATVYPDNIVEFVATERQFWSSASSLTQVLCKVVPVEPWNFDKGRYKMVTAKDYADCVPNYDRSWQHYRAARNQAQEYFQHLKVNIETGEVVNPKDMTPVVNEDKRKQWLAGLKSFRLKLRTMARLGLLGNGETANKYRGYISIDEQKHLAEAIMRGECDPESVALLVAATSKWRVQRSGKTFGECVVDTFENTVKSNSRDIRAHVGVIDLQK